MAIWGGDGSSKANTAYCDTWDDFIYLFTNANYGHIGFPESYDGDKVIDLRKKGWLKTTYTVASPTNTKYIYGNGWTILGGSIMDCRLLQIARNSVYYSNIYDLTFKNFYIISLASNIASLFETKFNYPKCFYNCKFSATFDGAAGGSYSAFIYGGTGSNTDTCYFYQCSFNFKIHGKFYFSTGQNCVHYCENCLVNLTTSEYGIAPENSNNNYVVGGIYRFSKITGKVKLAYWSWTTTVYYIAKCSYGNVYNVVDLEMDKAPSVGSLSCGVSITGYQDSLAAFVCNKTKIEKNGFTFYTPDATRVIGATEADMTNKSYLESIYFLVGDTPTS